MAQRAPSNGTLTGAFAVFSGRPRKTRREAYAPARVFRTTPRFVRNSILHKGLRGAFIPCYKCPPTATLTLNELACCKTRVDCRCMTSPAKTAPCKTVGVPCTPL